MMTVRLWKEEENAAKNAVANPGVSQDLGFDGHRDVFKDMERSIVRGGSPHSLAEFTKWFTTGMLHLVVGNYMSASYRLQQDAGHFHCQIVHVGGQWNRSEAEWMVRGMRRQMRIWCVSEVQYEGRPGWARFLKKQGLEL